MKDPPSIRIDEWNPVAVPLGKHRFRVDLNVRPGPTPLFWSALVIRGMADGPVLLITAGVHGDEYEGMAGIRRFVASLDPAFLAGTIIAIPVVHEAAFEAASRNSPLDGENLARVFPGSADGTPTRRIAHALSQHLLPKCSFYCDLHTGGIHYSIVPLCGYQIGGPGYDDIQHRACVAFDLSVIWATAYLPGRSLSAAREAGVPAIYVEYSGGGGCLDEDVAHCCRSLLNVAACLGLIDARYPREFKGTFMRDDSDQSGHLQVQGIANASGFFQPLVGLWDAVRRGDTVGVIVDPLGEVVDTLKADRDGRIIFLRKTRYVPAGEGCFAVAS